MPLLPQYILDTLRSPREHLSRGQKFLRKSYELVVYCYRQLKHQRADGMAAELTYRTIFALIPVVVLGLVMFRLVGGLEDIQAKVENQLFSFFGVPDVTDGYAAMPAGGIILPKDSVNQSLTSEPPLAGSDERQQLQSPNAADQVVPTQAQPPSSSTLPDKLSSESNANPRPNQREFGGAQTTGTLGGPNPLQNPKDELTDPKSAAAFTTRDPADDANGESEFAAVQQARISIRRTLHDLADRVSSVNFASIGVFGLLLFTYAAVALANAAEHLFNRIYEAPSKRPAHLRLAIHWSILTLGGGLLAMSLYLSGQMVERFGNVEGSETLKPFLTHCVSLLASWVLLFLVYALMPNTRVSVRAAAIGSAVSAVLWEVAKYGFQIYLSEAVPYSLYGSLGLIPLFLFWIYLTWLLVLFGLILTYTLQALGGHLPDQFDPQQAQNVEGDPDWMLPIMCEVGNSFANGESLDHQTLSNRIGISSRSVHELTAHLLDAELLLQVTSSDSHDGLTLSRPADKITLVEILDLAHRIRPPHHHAAWRAFSSLKEAERQAAQGKTLADFDF